MIPILIVEDLPSDAEFCEREVKKVLPDSQCLRVETQEDFLAALDSFRPEVIISDYKMPRFDGMTALTLALERVPETPFLILTGSMNEETAMECMKAGAWDYVVKEHIRRLGPAVLSALERKQNRDERRKAEADLLKLTERLRKTLGAVVKAIATAVETKDPYTAGHQRRTSDLARSIAEEMGLTADQVDFIRTASSIHDIGKISIPAEILSKPTRLSEIEFNLIKIHTQAGHDILKDIEFLWPVATVVLQHHERMDGSGYPAGLRGEAILPEARVLAVADVVEAMASHRPYRPALGIDAALEEIANGSGSLYDPAVAKACLKLFKEDGYRLVG
ncbi:MAG: HD domain-containing phosphohydrolase [Thermodesulfobacteriota bacterium]